jgi:DNA repair exonuclease SbcCD nuclease subunit
VSGEIIFADPHLGMQTHDPDGKWRRTEAEQVFADIGNAARELDAGVICAGDMFHTPRPPAWAYKIAAGLDADMIPGNHDWPQYEGAVSPLSILGGELFDRPQVARRRDFDVAFIPWFGRSFVAANYPDLAVGEQNRYMALALERIAADLATQKRVGVPMIAVTHFTVSGMAWNSEVQPQVGESADFIAPWSALDRPEFSVVFAGHVHKPQTLHDGRLVSIGSPFRSDFGEEGQEARVLHVALDGAGEIQWQAILTGAVEFVSLPWDAPADSAVKGKVVRFVGEAPAGESTADRLRKLAAECYALGALRVAKPAVKFIRHEARATRNIEVDSTPDTALREYAGLVGGVYGERLKDLLAVQAELVEAAR